MTNIFAFPHILGSPSSYMTLHPIPSVFPNIWGEFSFLFQQWKRTTNPGVQKMKNEMVKEGDKKDSAVTGLWRGAHRLRPLAFVSARRRCLLCCRRKACCCNAISLTKTRKVWKCLHYRLVLFFKLNIKSNRRNPITSLSDISNPEQLGLLKTFPK